MTIDDPPIALPYAVLQDLRTVLTEMRAAERVAELPTVELEMTKTDAVRRVELVDGFMLSVSSGHSSGYTPKNLDGSLDWGRIHRLMILSIEPPT